MATGIGVRLPARPSPFFAPLDEVEIGHAMALGGVGSGMLFLDLGCGDGRVMEAALERGAAANGVELDLELARAARRRLARFGDRARVQVEDFYSADLSADVVFAYVTPATLQRLSPRLAELDPGTRIVTAWFPVPGWSTSSYLGNCHLFEAPVDSTPIARHSAAGWASPGILCFLPPNDRFLVTAELTHLPGPVQVEPSPALTRIANVSLGAEAVDVQHPVAVDIVFEGRPPGTMVAGTLVSTDAQTCELFCYYHPDDRGYWPLDVATCERVRHTFAVAAVPTSG